MYSNAILAKALKNKDICIQVNLAERIRELRESHGMTRIEFADKVRVNKGQIWEWESGYKEPTERSLKKLCDAFGLDITYFEQA